MGRKKRKVDDHDAQIVPSPEEPESKQWKTEPIDEPPISIPIPIPELEPLPTTPLRADAILVGDDKKDTNPAASSYGLHAHSADIVEEDVYISDGSEDEADMEADIVLAGSRMGVMRRGLHHSLLVQPTRQWKREDAAPSEAVEDAAAVTQEDDDILAQLDPAQRAARLLQEKQRKIQDAKETARRLESEENAGRDPCLFSKRTAFDIRMDQIEDKPWTRGDMTDFFNYSLTEEDWMDYSSQQLAIRHELTEAARQRRPPDPTIVPVQARTPTTQTPKVAIAGESTEDGVDVAMGVDDAPVIGPAMPQGVTEIDVSVVKTEETEQTIDLQYLGSGGAWGAGAAPGSLLARLIEEQDNGGASHVAPVAESSRTYEEESYHEPEQQYGRGHDDRDGHDNNQGGGYDRKMGYGNQQQSQGFDGRGGYGGGRSGGDYEDRGYGAPPPSWAGRGGRGGPPPWAARGGRGRGRGGHSGNDDIHSRYRGQDDHYGGGNWR